MKNPESEIEDPSESYDHKDSPDAEAVRVRAGMEEEREEGRWGWLREVTPSPLAREVSEELVEGTVAVAGKFWEVEGVGEEPPKVGEEALGEGVPSRPTTELPRLNDRAAELMGASGGGRDDFLFQRDFDRFETDPVGESERATKEEEAEGGGLVGVP